MLKSELAIGGMAYFQVCIF